jgi:hypothetical protein
VNKTQMVPHSGPLVNGLHPSIKTFQTHSTDQICTLLKCINDLPLFGKCPTDL